VSYFFSDQIMLWTYRAIPVEGADVHRLNETVEALAKKAGLPKPKVYMLPTATPNAFATGRSPEHSAIAVTEGLIHLLTPDELRGVLAHELSHIQHQDTFIMMIAATLGSMVMFFARSAQWILFMGKNKDEDHPGQAVVTVIMSIFAPIAAFVIQMAVSRNREFLADQGASTLTGNPQALAQALWKIHHYNQSAPMPALATTAHLFIINPLTSGGLNKLFSSHPPVEERIKKLIGRTL
jgi:heat shock protein HtpX